MAKPRRPRAVKIARDGRQIKAWLARIRYKDAAGIWRDRSRICDTYAAAQMQLDAWARGNIAAGRRRFVDLADYFKTHYAIPPVYDSAGNKIAGYKGALSTIHLYLGEFVAAFGDLALSDLTYEHIRSYALQMAARGVAVATVHRRLALLRHVLNVGVQLQWLSVNPFTRGRALIKPSLERVRQRIVSHAEESAILAECTDKRVHMLPIILLALDAGMRRGEILRLTWQQIDLASSVIYITGQAAKATKSGKAGVLPLTDRARIALEQWRLIYPNETRVFPFNDIKRAWATICRNAKIDDLQFRDLRTHAGTVLASLGYSPAFVAKILRNSPAIAEKHYIHPDISDVQQAGNRLNERNRPQELTAIQ